VGGVEWSGVGGVVGVGGVYGDVCVWEMVTARVGLSLKIEFSSEVCPFSFVVSHDLPLAVLGCVACCVGAMCVCVCTC
jgi:hypothetical protein